MTEPQVYLIEHTCGHLEWHRLWNAEQTGPLPLEEEKLALAFLWTGPCNRCRGLRTGERGEVLKDMLGNPVAREDVT